MSDSQAGRGFKAVLANTKFRNLWLGQLVSQVGEGITGLTVLIAINHLTGSAASVAAMAVAMSLPSLLFGLVSGVYADRWDRRRIMIVSDVLRGLLVLCFLLVSHRDQVWIFYVIAFLQAAIGTLFMPAKSALMPMIVSPELLPAANGLSQLTQGVANASGAALTGFMFGAFGTTGLAFGLSATTFFVSAWFVFKIPASATAISAKRASSVGSVFSEFRQGLGFLLGKRNLVGAVLTIAVTMLGMGAIGALFVPFLSQTLGAPAHSLGTVSVAQLAGGLIGSVSAAALVLRFKTHHLVFVCVTLVGLLIGVIGATDTLGQVLAAIFVISLLAAPVHVILTTLMQTSVPVEMLGRINSVMMVAIGLASVVSMLTAGVLSEMIGIREVFALAGAIVMLAGIVSVFAMRDTDGSNVDKNY